MIWLKRLLPIVILAAAGAGYHYWDEARAARQEALTHRYALATAKVWLVSAVYRDSSERYLAARDSLLAAEGLSADSVERYLDLYQEKPEEYEDYAALVKAFMDSLAQTDFLDNVQDSIPPPDGDD